jgi:hypothetical protein
VGQAGLRFGDPGEQDAVVKAGQGRGVADPLSALKTFCGAEA